MVVGSLLCLPLLQSGRLSRKRSPARGRFSSAQYCGQHLRTATGRDEECAAKLAEIHSGTRQDFWDWSIEARAFQYRRNPIRLWLPGRSRPFALHRRSTAGWRPLGTGCVSLARTHGPNTSRDTSSYPLESGSLQARAGLVPPAILFPSWNESLSRLVGASH